MMTLATCLVRYALAKAKGDKADMAIFADRILQRGGELPLEPKKPEPVVEVKPKTRKKV